MRKLFCSLFFLALGCLSTALFAEELKSSNAKTSHARTTWQLTGIELSLYGPDNPVNPIVWEGPLEIKSSRGAKLFELNLISNLYAMGNSIFTLSYSGNLYYLDMFDMKSQVHLVKSRKISSGQISISAQQISVMPACECVENDVCHCNAAQIFEWNSKGINYNREASIELTKRKLGTGFEGNKTISKSAIRN